MAGPNGSLPNAQLAVDDFQDLQVRHLFSAYFPVTDLQCPQYTVNITLGGQSKFITRISSVYVLTRLLDFSVVLDTGSSDLWVIADGPLSLTNDSGLGTALAFGRGAIEGPIQFAELQVGEYVVPSQGACHAEFYGRGWRLNTYLAFINVNRVRTMIYSIANVSDNRAL